MASFQSNKNPKAHMKRRIAMLKSVNTFLEIFMGIAILVGQLVVVCVTN